MRLAVVGIWISNDSQKKRISALMTIHYTFEILINFQWLFPSLKGNSCGWSTHHSDTLIAVGNLKFVCRKTSVFQCLNSNKINLKSWLVSIQVEIRSLVRQGWLLLCRNQGLYSLHVQYLILEKTCWKGSLFLTVSFQLVWGRKWSSNMKRIHYSKPAWSVASKKKG